MKLKELLKVVPDNYLIALMDTDMDNYSISTFGDKESCIKDFGKEAGMPPAHVKVLPVVAIHPGASICMPSDVTMYGADSTELRAETHLLIEVSTDEEEKEK